MAHLATKTFRKIRRDRRFEDYQSLKQYYRYSKVEEFIVRGYNLTTATAAELKPDGTQALTVLSAEACAYVKSEADLAALDTDSVYITYMDDDGVVYTVETLLDGGTYAIGATDNEVPLGCENLTDTVAAVAGETITLTALPGTLNQYAGYYVVGVSGDQKGTAVAITSNTAATPTVLTLASTPNANYAADIVSIQEWDPTNFYRLREMSCETEAPTDNRILCCDDDGSDIYGQISDGGTEAGAFRYFAPAATSGKDTHYYLGYIKARAITHALTGDDEELGYNITITFTPKALDSNVPAADITLVYPFDDNLDLDLCIEIEPATDVIVYISKVLDANHENMYVEYCILEVDRID